MSTLKELAEEFAAAFETAKRKNAAERGADANYVRLKDPHPRREAFRDICLSAHGDLFPDDTRYKMISEVADRLTERDPDEWDDDAAEACDALVDIMNMDRIRWLASHISRAGYCDQAIEDGLVAPDADLFTRIGIGQYKEYEEIWHAVAQGLRELAESEEGGDA